MKCVWTLFVTLTQMYQLRMLSDLEELKVMAYVQEYFIVISPVQSNGKGTCQFGEIKKN